MKKILVPTDFSWNSRAGLRFAIQLASQQELELVIVHVIHIMRPIQVIDEIFIPDKVMEKNYYKTKLEKFAGDIYTSMSIKPGKHSFLVLEGDSVDLTIMNYCRQHKEIDAICISTRGAGGFKKIYGTNTGNLITKSLIPVMAVPKTFRAGKINKVLFATDLDHFGTELKKVIAFAKPLNAKLEVLHLSWLNDILPEQNIIDKMMRNLYNYKLKVNFITLAPEKTWIKNMQEQIYFSKPSVVVMFTHPEKNIFQKLFTPGKSEQLSFQLRVPMLVFRKNAEKQRKRVAKKSGTYSLKDS